MDKPTSTPLRFTTVKEVARLLRVSKMTVYRLVESGEISSSRVGKQIRIPTTEVTRYLERDQIPDTPVLRVV